jgi:hypothetical protein
MAAGTVTTDLNVYRSYPLTAARKVCFTAGTTDLALIPAGQIKYLLGWRISETAGATAACVLQDSVETIADVNVDNFGLITLVAHGQDEVWYGPNGVVLVSTGLFLHVTSGTVSGVVYFTGG